jgi:ATP-binding cassette, subfamily B (MDR/TAP), member 1
MTVGDSEKDSQHLTGSDSTPPTDVLDLEKAVAGQAALPARPIDEPTTLGKLDSRILKVKEEGESDPLEKLSETERAILKRQTDQPEVQIGYFGLFRYTTTLDKLIMAVSAFCAIAGGALMPLMTVS